MLRALKFTVFGLLLVSLMALSFGAGVGLAPGVSRGATAIAQPQGPRQTFDRLGEIIEVLRQDFVNNEALDPERLEEGAIKGLLESLGDPNTSFIERDVFRLEQSSFRGAFDGIGAQVTTVEKRLTVVTPFAGSPAEKAGMRPGDVILKVNGETTANMGLAEAVNKIRGPRGTKVTLEVLHQGEAQPVVLDIVRDEIAIRSVFARMLNDDIAHLRITHFSDRTGDEIKVTLKELRDQKAKAIVLDLRDNPGGVLTTTVEVTSQFLKEGVVLYEVDSKGNKREWRVRSGGVATDVPLVVLANQASASGSEVLAGALQDAKRAILIGTKTLGKGTVNHLRELSDGSALYVSFAHWVTPKGRQINGLGLDPDVEVPLSEDDLRSGRDPQLDRAIEYIRTKV